MNNGKEMDTSTSSAELSTSRNSEYIYKAIRNDEIRLLRGHLDKNEVLRGELRAFSLDSKDLPSFQTLSYAWGAPNYNNTMLIGDQELPVLDSVHQLLRRVVTEDSHRRTAWWWIDCLSINQKDGLEKGAQIAMMGTIYRTSRQTVVWLGEEADGSADAIRFLHWIGKELSGPHGIKKPSKAWLAEVVPIQGPHGKDWKALEMLFARPWWSRVWTVQEYILPSNLTFRCGKSEFSRAALRRSLLAIWECKGKVIRYDGPWNRTRLLEWHKRFGENQDLRAPGISLTAALAYLGHHEATDPRDRIYSLVGMVKDFDLAGVPDYTQTFEVLYSRIVKSFVEKYGSLDIICYSSIFKGSGPNWNPRIPSWTPDWSVKATVMVGPMMVSQPARHWIGNLRPLHRLDHMATYCASLHLEAKVTFTSDLREMTCQGFILDSIDGLAATGSRAKPSREGDQLVQSASQLFDSSNPPLSAREASKILISIMRCVTLDREDHYFNHYIPTFEFSEEFRSLLDMSLSSDLKLNYSFKSWFEANRPFLVRGFTFEALVRKWLEKWSVEKGDYPRLEGPGPFLSRFNDTLRGMSRRLAITTKGIFCMAPNQARQGDQVCILYGCSVPVVLRKSKDTDSFTFIGECYADGYMNGEAFSKGKDLDSQALRLV